MDLHEYFKDKEVVEIRNGWDGYENLENIIGNEVWICDYRISDPNNKPIRSVTPKLVRIFNNDDLPQNKTVYYSPIHFREVKANKVLSTVIAPYDNTGYRCISGKCVNIFESKEMCVAYFNNQLVEAIDKMRKYKERQTNYIDSQIKTLEVLFSKYE